jgi:Glycosyl transferases group 1
MALGELGCDVRILPEEALEPVGADLVWASGSANWFPGAYRRLVETPPGECPPVVLWHTELLPFARSAGQKLEPLHLREVATVLLRDPGATDPRTNFRALRRWLEHGLPDLLVVTTREKQEFLAEQGIAAEFVPAGYHHSLGRDLDLERDIDVLFLGALDVPRRERILRRIRRAGVEVRAVGGWGDPAFWGENRTHLLNRAKILLNLPRHPGLLSGKRMILGMANKALVISERVHLPEPYVAGEHYVSATLDAMPEAIRGYLADEGERRRITENAYRFVTEELTMSRSVSSILARAEVRFRSRAS